jgi:hypothetical protein
MGNFTQNWSDQKWVKIFYKKCDGKSKGWWDTAQELRLHFDLALQ